VILAARIAAAFAGAIYSPIALIAAIQVSPDARRGRAVSVVLAGLTISLVVGVPLGTLLGYLGSWRWTFLFVAALASLTAIGLGLLLPIIPAGPKTPVRVRFAVLRRPAVVASLIAGFLWTTGAFTIYTFIAPVLRAATGWSGTALSALLLIYGAAAFAGNHIGGLCADRLGARRTLIIALSSLVVSLTALAYAIHRDPKIGIPIAIVALIAWAGAGWSLTPPQAHRLIELAPSVGPEVLSLNTSALYLGIAAGSALGGRALAHFGTASLGLTGAAFQLIPLVAIISFPFEARQRRRRRASTESGDTGNADVQEETEEDKASSSVQSLQDRRPNRTQASALAGIARSQLVPRCPRQRWPRPDSRASCDRPGHDRCHAQSGLNFRGDGFESPTVVLGCHYTNTLPAAKDQFNAIIDGGTIGLTASNTVLRSGVGDR
jgi:predicted MFS family arabinose efflux permease